MNTTPPRDTWKLGEWNFIAARINDIVQQQGPHLTMNMFGSEPSGYPRTLFSFGMHTELAQVKQLSGFMAIEGISPAEELVEMYRAFCDPSDRGVQLVHDLAYDNRPLFCDGDGDTIMVTEGLWKICRFFRLHLGMSLASSPAGIAEWYHNPEEGLQRKSQSVEAHFAAELYLRLKVWENMSMSSTPALVDDLQALIAGLNGLYEATGEDINMLQSEVHRRELDLVLLYLSEQPEVPIPAQIHAELSRHLGSESAAIVALAELRRHRDGS